MNKYSQGLRDALSQVGLIHTGASWATGFFVGAGFGLVAGATVALLLTPSSGPEMRQELGWRAKKLAQRTQELAHRTQEAVSDVAENVKGKLGTQREAYRGQNEIPVG